MTKGSVAQCAAELFYSSIICNFAPDCACRNRRIAMLTGFTILLIGLDKISDWPHKHKAETLMIAIIIVCIIPNIVLSCVEPMSLTARIANVILPLGILWLLLSLSRNVGRTVLCLFPICLFDAFQLVLLCIYGQSIIGIDMMINVETTNPSEAWELLSHILIELTIVVLMYLAPTVVAIMAIAKRWRIGERFIRRSRKLSLWCIVAGVAVLGLTFATSGNRYKPGRQLFPYNIACNMVQATKRSEAIKNYPKSSASFRFNASDTDSVAGKRKITVLVIGETSRADNWSLFGYDRPTTLALDTMRGIFPFSKAISESNTTHKSVPMLLTHLDATNFGDSIYYVRGLPAAFSEAGWKTYFLSNQRRNHSLIDMIASQADSLLFIKDTDGNRALDKAMIPHLRKVLEDGPKRQLIVLHTYGSHFNYADRYDPSNALYKDASTKPTASSNREGLVKAYDNSIHYTAQFLHDIIKEVSATGAEAVLVYTSDHGEDIYDDERHLFLHASPIPSFYQLHVPYFVWLSDSYINTNAGMARQLRDNSSKNVSSTATLFNTVLMLSGINSSALRPDRSLASPNYRFTNHYYLNDYNEEVNLKGAGFKAQDFNLLRKMKDRK